MSLQLFLRAVHAVIRDIFHCDPKLTCAAPVESDYYSRQTNPLKATGDFSRDLNLCAICAGTSHDPVGGEVDPLTQI